MRSLLFAVVMVLVLAVAGTWTGVDRVQAQSGGMPGIYPFFPQTLTLGMVGLAPGHTARLYALNQAAPTPPGVLDFHTTPCNLTLSFLDDQGTTLKTAALTADSNKAVHLDLAHDEVTSDSSRLQIRGVVVQAAPTPGPVGTAVPIPIPFGCSAAPTLEIFNDATGATTVVLESARGVPAILPLMGGVTTPTTPAP